MPDEYRTDPNGQLLINVGGNYIKANSVPAEIKFNRGGPDSAHKVSTVTVKIDVFDNKNKLNERDATMVIEVPTVNELANALKFNAESAFQVNNFPTTSKKRPLTVPFSTSSPLGGDRNALNCAKCANMIYNDNVHDIAGLDSVTGNMKLATPNDGADPNHTHWHIWKDKTQPGVYFLAFRGTHMSEGQYIDVISDISAIPIFVPLSLGAPNGTKVGIHGGFFTGISNNRDAIYDALRVNCPDLKKLYVTGHSLGAALSQVFLFFHLRDHAQKAFTYTAQTISFAAPQSIHARDSAVNQLITLFQGKSVNYVFNRDVVPLVPRMLVNRAFMTELLKDAMDVAKAKLGVPNVFLNMVSLFSGAKSADVIGQFVGVMMHTMGFCVNYDVYHDTVHVLKDKDRTVAVLQTAAERNAWFRDDTVQWNVMDLTTCIMDHTMDNYQDAVGKIVSV